MFYRHKKQQQAGPGLGQPCKNNGAGAGLELSYQGCLEVGAAR